MSDDWSAVLFDGAPPAELINASTTRPRQPWFDLARGVSTSAVFDALDAIAHDRQCIAPHRTPAPVEWVPVRGGIAARCPDCGAYAIVGATRSPARGDHRRGPSPMTTAQAIAGARQALELEEATSAAAEGRAPKVIGERLIAQRLAVSRGAVRYALGKDRR